MRRATLGLIAFLAGASYAPLYADATGRGAAPVPAAPVPSALVTQPASNASTVLAMPQGRGPESAAALAGRLGLTYTDGGSFLLLTDGVSRVRIFPNSHRLSLDGQEQSLRGYFSRAPGGVTVPGPAAGIIESHVGQARARLAALKQTAPAPAPLRETSKPLVAAPPALPKPMAKPPARATPSASSVQPDAGWAVAPGDRTWKWIILHHSDDTSGDLAKYHQGHLDRGWEHGCGYHFVIGNGSLSGDGEVEVSQRWKQQLHGAHAKTPDNRFNDYGIGIVLVGDFEKGSGRPTQAQMRALVRLTQWLMDQHGIPMANVQGHCYCKATCCPGKNFPWTELRSKLRQPATTKVPVAPGPSACAVHDASDHDASGREHALGPLPAAPGAASAQAPKVAALAPGSAADAGGWLPGATAPTRSAPSAGPRAVPVPPALGLPPAGTLPAPSR